MAIPHPLDAQFPLVARPNVSYTWAFLPDSFPQSDDTLDFSVTDLPGWATFDPATRSFSGTPAEGDVDATTVTVSAASSDGGGDALASSTFTLLVSSEPAPSLGTPLSAQFSSSALSALNSSISSAFPLNTTSSPPALRIPPAWSFSIGLSPASFSPPSSQPYEPLFYAARQPSGDPLPDWLVFSNTSLTFGGVTPSDPAPPYELDVELIVSDIWGFSAQSETFRIELSAHDLELSTASLNVTAGEPFSLDLAQVLAITLDGTPLSPGMNLSAVQLLSGASLPSWLAFDASSSTLSGTAPSSAPSEPVQVPVNITTTYPAPPILTNLSIALFPSYFVPQSFVAQPLQAVPGQPFTFSLGPVLSNASALAAPQLSASFSPSSLDVWLSLSPGSSIPTLSGTPPLTLPYTTGNVTLLALSPHTNTSSSLLLPLSLSPSTSSATASQTPSNPSLTPGARKALIVLGSLAAAMLAVLCLLCYVRRRHRAASQSGRVRKSLIGKAYVLEQGGGDGEGGESPEVPALGKELLVGDHGPLHGVDEMGRLEGALGAGVGEVYLSDLPASMGGGGAYVPKYTPNPQRPQQARTKTSPTTFFARLATPIPFIRSLSSPSPANASSNSNSHGTDPLDKRNISRPLPRVSRVSTTLPSFGRARSVRPHPGMGVPAGRGILIRTPDPPVSYAGDMGGGGGAESVRFVGHGEGRPESWTPPPSVLPTPSAVGVGGNPFEGLEFSGMRTGMGASSTGGATVGADGQGGYYKPNRTYMTPTPTVGSGTGSGSTGSSGTGGSRGANPFFHAREGSLGVGRGAGGGGGRNPFRREESGSSSETGGGGGVVGVERPVQRRDFAAVRSPVPEEEEPEDGEGETEEEEEEEAVIGVAERVSSEGGRAKEAAKAARMVEFTSERRALPAGESGRRLASHKALVSPSLSSPASNSNSNSSAHQLGTGFRYVSSASLANRAGPANATSPSVGSAVIYDGSVSTGLGSGGSGGGSGGLAKGRERR